VSASVGASALLSDAVSELDAEWVLAAESELA
jgi:hypothetical protein